MRLMIAYQWQTERNTKLFYAHTNLEIKQSHLHCFMEVLCHILKIFTKKVLFHLNFFFF